MTVRKPMNGVSPHATKADARVAAADAKAREASARADLADRRAERLEAALERIGERLDAIERRMERREPAEPVQRAAEGREESGGVLLYGVQAIADFLGVRKRQALGLIERGHLPHYHVGKIVCANRAALAAWLDARATEAASKPDPS